MDLFVINRYTGEEEHDSGIDEKEKLSRISLKVKKCRKLRHKPSTNAGVEHNLPADQNTAHVKIDHSINSKINIHESDSSEEEPASKKFKNSEEIVGFTILGTEHFNKREKAKRVLPKWLLNPTVINGSLQNLYVEVKDMTELDNDLTAKLIENGIKYFFPVQAQVMPWLLTSSKHSELTVPQDVCVSAPTGSGKTLTYVLPTIQLLKDRCRKALRALVVLPTQSLGIQIHQVFTKYSANTGLDVGIIIGNTSFNKERGELIESNTVWGNMTKIDILICTPGKLVDHLKSTEGFNLADLEYLIIDEADRVLETVQEDWLYHLADRISEDRRKMGLNVLCARRLHGSAGPRKLLFSATLSQDPEKLQRLSLFQPRLFTCLVDDNISENLQSSFIGKYTTPDGLSERCIVCSPLAKPLALYKLLKDNGLTRVLIFTGSIESVHRLKLVLQYMFHNELTVDEISSSQNLNVRRSLIESFMSDLIDVLVCTDAMARGIDLPRVDCVISYNAAKHIKTYIHRAGRTARAGGPGLSITFVQPEQKSPFLNMLEQAGKHNVEYMEYTNDDLENYSDLYNMALNHLKGTVTNEIQINLSNMKTQKKRLLHLNVYKRKQFRNKVKKYVK